MITIHDLRAWKSEGTRWAMLTAYDFPTAQILDQAGVPVLLVGDSVGRNVLGYANELPVTMEEMLHHTRAVVRGTRHALVIGDMPFLSYSAPDEAIETHTPYPQPPGLDWDAVLPDQLAAIPVLRQLHDQRRV